jgi:hypothetical protein
MACGTRSPATAPGDSHTAGMVIARHAGMTKWIAVIVLLAAACGKKKSDDMPPTCFKALDCCSSLGSDLDDPALADVKDACEAAKRHADEGSDEKCFIAFGRITSSFWNVYPTRGMGPTCEAR